MSEENVTTPAPALTAAEWARVIADGPEAVSGTIEDAAYHPHDDEGRFAAVVALGNYGLPDSDLRKITRATVNVIRACASIVREAYPADSGRTDYRETADRADTCADTLAALLPPEG